MKIGIVNDTPFSVMALRRTLALKPELQVIWIAQNGAQAVEMCAKETPDLVLMDLIMPVMDGIEATRRIMSSTPCAILIVTASVGSNAARVFEAMGHGALDAVSTPELGTETGAAPFLAKINILGKLIDDRVPSDDNPLARTLPRRRSEKLVVIGASAGGPAAVGSVLRGLPKDFPAAVVLVQHVDEHFAAGMAEWLGKGCQLPVRVAQEGDRLVPGVVLLAGTGDHLKLRKADQLGYSPEPRDHAYRPSVDVFFHSVSDCWPGEVVGVLLTGMGRDGAQGLKSLRDKGHFTIAQDQATSAVYGMPKAAAALDAATEILPVDAIAQKLVALMAGKR